MQHITLKFSTLCLTAATIALTACGNTAKEAASEVVETTASAVQSTTASPLQSVIDHPRRDEERARDQFRNPKETLEFFGIAPGQHVIELWPGWYTNVIAPYTKETGGTYTAVLFPDLNERLIARSAAFKENYSDTEAYGDIQYGSYFRDQNNMTEPGTADLALTFRNVHNWMGGQYADKVFAAFYEALKPGGILGVVEHRLPESAEQDPRGRTGYIQQSYMIKLAEDAGFEFVAASEVNANPKDTADHPFGVWTLPPSSRTPEEGSEEAEGFDAEFFKSIGESDRATLKFRKPE